MIAQCIVGVSSETYVLFLAPKGIAWSFAMYYPHNDSWSIEKSYTLSTAAFYSQAALTPDYRTLFMNTMGAVIYDPLSSSLSHLHFNDGRVVGPDFGRLHPQQDYSCFCSYEL